MKFLLAILVVLVAWQTEAFAGTGLPASRGQMVSRRGKTAVNMVSAVAGCAVVSHPSALHPTYITPTPSPYTACVRSAPGASYKGCRKLSEIFCKQRGANKTKTPDCFGAQRFGSNFKMYMLLTFLPLVWYVSVSCVTRRDPRLSLLSLITPQGGCNGIRFECNTHGAGRMTPWVRR